jgi:hypothetical protein
VSSRDGCLVSGVGIYGSANKCTNNGDISLTTPEGLLGTSAYRVAGINIYSKDFIRGCANTGDLSVDTSVTHWSYRYIAHTVGIGDANLIENCFNRGEIKTKTNEVFGNTAISCGIGDGNIINCYSIGLSSSTTSANSGISNTETLINNSYYLTSTAQSANYKYPDSKYSNVHALSQAQLRQQSSFVGFDFDTVWAINPAINSVRGMQP